MECLRVSAVSYLNTFPFVYGLRESGIMHNIRLELDVPSVCAENFKAGKADIALVPAGALPELTDYKYVSDFCIGAVNPVRTVLLLSKKPLDQISKVYLDFDSRTSVELVKVLARHYWQINPEWKNLKSGQSSSGQDLESLVAIGDKTFEISHHFPYVYDLAEAWIDFTGLPFVFAVWISRSQITALVEEQFNRALLYGINHKRECLDYFIDKLPAGIDCLSYLEDNISYKFDAKKKQGVERFLGFLTK